MHGRYANRKENLLMPRTTSQVKLQLWKERFEQFKLGDQTGSACGRALLVPTIGSLMQLRFYGAAMGFVGGMITVIHFAAWGQLFGRAHLGRIQGITQAGSVLASALGPMLTAWCHASMNSYLPIYYFFAGCVLVLAIAAIFVPTPPLQSTLHPLSTQE